MDNVNKVLITTEKNYKIYDENNNEIGEITERYSHKTECYTYIAMRCFKHGNYRMTGIYSTWKTALKKLLEDTKGVYFK